MAEHPVHEEGARGRRPLPIGVVVGAFGVLVAVGAAGMATGGELGQFVMAGAEVAPLAALAVLAYLGADRPWARVLAILWMVALVGGLILLGLVGSADALAARAGGPEGERDLSEAGVATLGVIAALSLVALLASMAGFLPGVRRPLSRLLPIEPDSFVHAVALVAVVAITLVGLVPLILLSVPPLLANPDLLADDAVSGLRDAPGRLRDDLYALVWTLPAALFAVGLGVRRGPREALERLGLVSPTRRQVLAGVAVGLVLVLGAGGVGQGIEGLWAAMGWPLTDAEAFGKLVAYSMSPVGAMVVGVSAGLGEEVAVRGVLQPRLGLLLSNLFFTSLHAFQYNWDALALVFLLGLAMGVVRRRANTTTSAVVHGSYDFLAMMLDLVELPGLAPW